MPIVMALYYDIEELTAMMLLIVCTKKLGFKATGEADEDEIIMVKELVE